MTEIDPNLSSNPGHPRYYLSNDIVLLWNKRVSPYKYSLLCNNDQKIFDISHILDSDEVSELNDDANLSNNGMWCCIFHKNIFCKVKIFYNNGLLNIEIIHYDISNNMKEENRKNIQLLYCVHDCVKHSNHNCTLKDDQQICLRTCILRIDKYNHIAGLSTNGTLNHKQYNNFMFNVQTLENKAICDGYCIHTSLDDYIFFRMNGQFNIYNHKTDKELILKCDKIETYIRTTDKYFLGYMSGGKFKYFVLPKSNSKEKKSIINFDVKLKNEKIIVTANDMFYEYECEIDTYRSYNFIHSMEMMYEIIKDAVDGTDKNVIFEYKKINDTIEIQITINIKYIMNKINFVLIQKPIDQLQILDKKINYLYEHNKIELL
jgi:hypothetical protein